MPVAGSSICRHVGMRSKVHGCSASMIVGNVMICTNLLKPRTHVGSLEPVKNLAVLCVFPCPID